MPAIQRAQQMQQANLSQMYAAEMAAKSRAGEAQADFMLRNMMFNQGQELDAAKFAASRELSGRDVGLAQLEMAQQQQKFALMADFENNQLTQSDSIRHKKLQQAEATIEQMGAQMQWSPEEVLEAKANVRNLKGPLEMKAAKHKMQMEEIQKKAVAA